MTAGVLLSVLAAVDAGASAAPAPPTCDALYFGEGVTRDYKRALACYRAGEEWIMVAIMQLNGEGTPVDVAAARKSLEADEARDAATFQSGDERNLDRIIEKREANPNGKFRRVDYCGDVAGATDTLDWCQERAFTRENEARKARLAAIRARLTVAEAPLFDQTVAAFDKFVEAEGLRAYQQYAAGSVRNSFSMDQEKMVRENFEATMKILVADLATVPKSPRAFADADRELNVVYRETVKHYAGGFAASASLFKDAASKAEYRKYAADYRVKARDAQRAWIHYRDAAAKLADARWPKAPAIEDVVRAFITESRIRELRNSLDG